MSAEDTPVGGGRIVVVGAGMAATRLVEELVRRGVGDRVTLLGEERHAPYNRILLSAVLEGTHPVDALTLRDAGWYADRGVDLRLGNRVLAVDRDACQLHLADGTVLDYDRLVLATGSIPSLPPIRGLVRRDGRLHDRVHAFRTLEDCRRLGTTVDALAGALHPTGRAWRAVVVGGGLLGLQVARALAVRGLATEVVEGGEHLLRSQVGPAAGQVLGRHLSDLGTSAYTGARAVRLHDREPGTPEHVEGAVGLRLDNGYVLDTDLVVLTAGGRPSTALARAAGLSVGRGVLVDHALTSVDDPRVHALGDCAQHPGGETTGFVGPAWEQAVVLADVLTGGPASYDAVRSVARLRATGLDVAVLGDPERTEGQVVEMTNPVRRTHRKLVVRDGVVVAAAFVGDLSRVGLVTQHYDRGTRLGPGEPGVLLMGEGRRTPPPIGDDAEVCHCAGVTAGAVRACSNLAEAAEQSRATTGCGGCTAAVRGLLAERAAGTPHQSGPAPAAKESLR